MWGLVWAGWWLGVEWVGGLGDWGGGRRAGRTGKAVGNGKSHAQSPMHSVSETRHGSADWLTG